MKNCALCLQGYGIYLLRHHCRTMTRFLRSSAKTLEQLFEGPTFCKRKAKCCSTVFEICFATSRQRKFRLPYCLSNYWKSSTSQYGADGRSFILYGLEHDS